MRKSFTTALKKKNASGIYPGVSSRFAYSTLFAAVLGAVFTSAVMPASANTGKRKNVYNSSSDVSIKVQPGYLDSARDLKNGVVEELFRARDELTMMVVEGADVIADKVRGSVDSAQAGRVVSATGSVLYRAATTLLLGSAVNHATNKLGPDAPPVVPVIAHALTQWLAANYIQQPLLSSIDDTAGFFLASDEAAYKDGVEEGHYAANKALNSPGF